MQDMSISDRLAHHSALMPSRCEPSKRGPHHYECGRPTDGQVHCVCLKCGDERDYPAAGEDLPFVDRKPKPKGKRRRFDKLLEDESAPDLGPTDAEIEDESVPELVPAEDETSTESVPTEIQEKEEVTMPRLSLVQRRQELDAKKDFIIETWHRCNDNVSEAARVLEIAKSTLYGKLKQWRVVVPTPRPRGPAKQIRFEDRKEEIIATYLKTKSKRSADGHSATKAAKKLGMHISTLRQKLAQWGVLPTAPSRERPGRTRDKAPEASTGANGSAAIDEVKRLLREAGERVDCLQDSLTVANNDIAALEITLRLLEAKAVVGMSNDYGCYKEVTH